jgi:hypothetical protein
MALAHEAIRAAYINAGLKGIVAAPTFPMLRDSTVASLKQELDENEVPYEHNKNSQVIVLPEPRSTILLKSLLNPDRLRGTNVAWFGIDELTYVPQAAWSQLESRLREPKATHLSGFGVWTAKGFDWVWNCFISANRTPGYECFIAKPFENERLVRLGYYEKLKSSLEPRLYRQEVLGEFLNLFEGHVYQSFDRTKNVQPLAFQPHLPLEWAIDFNIDPLCSTISQFFDRANEREQRYGARKSTIHVLRELCLRESTTSRLADAMEDVLAAYVQQGLKLLKIYGDPAGDQRRTSASQTDWQILRRAADGWKHTFQIGVEFHVSSAAPAVRDRVNAVNALLCNAADERNLLVDPSCKMLITDLERVSWKSDGAGNLSAELSNKDKMLTHVSDALGYCVWRHTDLRGKAKYI